MKVMAISTPKNSYSPALKLFHIYTVVGVASCGCSESSILIEEFPDNDAGKLARCENCNMDYVCDQYFGYNKDHVIPIDDKETRDAFDKLNQLDKVKEGVK